MSMPQTGTQVSWLKPFTESEITSVLLARAKGKQHLSLGSIVVDLGDGRFVKSSHRTEELLTEAMAMEFVRTHTTIPVPQVHMFFMHGPIAFIVMDAIPGWTLLKVSHKLTPQACQNVAQQLHKIVTELGSLDDSSSRKNLYGQWPDKSFATSRRFAQNQNIPTFSSFDDLLSYIIPAGESLELSLDVSCTRPVLTHGDLSSNNIMVDLDGNILAILDWEMFGWYPAFWDRMVLLRTASYRAKRVYDAFEGAFGAFDSEMERLAKFVVDLAEPLFLD